MKYRSTGSMDVNGNISDKKQEIRSSSNNPMLV